MLIVKLERNKPRGQVSVAGQFANIDREEIIKRAVVRVTTATEKRQRTRQEDVREACVDGVLTDACVLG